MEHEKAVLAAFKAQELRVAEITEQGDPRGARGTPRWPRCATARDVIYQGTLLAAPLLRPHGLPAAGRASVEPRRAQLRGGRHQARAQRQGQVRGPACVLLRSARRRAGLPPHEMHLMLGDGRQVAFPVAEYPHYFADVRERFLAFVNGHPNATYPQRCAACGTCAVARHLCRAMEGRTIT